MTLQEPTTPFGDPGTPVSPSPSMAYTLVLAPSKGNLDASAPVSATTSTADIQYHSIIGPITANSGSITACQT
ncbi:hypothetical protein DFQ30_004944, partial [Apophysomyces sp. BC1015]